MADMNTFTFEDQSAEIDRFHFTVGLIVLTLATILSTLGLQFLILH
jgi:hypothetical protein